MNLAHQIRNVLRHLAMHAPLKTPNTSFSLKKQTNKQNKTKKNAICQDIFQGSRFSQQKKKKKKT